MSISGILGATLRMLGNTKGSSLGLMAFGPQRSPSLLPVAISFLLFLFPSSTHLSFLSLVIFCGPPHKSLLPPSHEQSTRELCLKAGRAGFATNGFLEDNDPLRHG